MSGASGSDTIKTGPDNAFAVEGYAWGDPGDQIRAGQTSSNPEQTDAVPTSGSLGLLALGSSGLLAWRKRRAEG